MKNTIILYAFAALALSLAACTQTTPDKLESGLVAANFSAGISTRATDGVNWNSDHIGIIVTDAGTETENMVTEYLNAEYIADQTGTSTTFSAADSDNTVYFDTDETVTFVAYAPYQTGDVNALPGTDGVISGSTLTQYASGASTQEEVDYLWASGQTASKSSPSVSFTFSHVMSQIVINVVAGDNMTDDDGIAAIQSGTYTLAGLVHSGTFNALTGATALDGTATAEDWTISSALPSSTTETGITYTGIIFPQSSTTLSFSATVGDDTYSSSNLIENEFVAGYTYTYKVTVSDTGLSIVGSIINAWIDPLEDLSYTPDPLYLSQLDNADYQIKNNTTVVGSTTAYTGHLTLASDVTELVFQDVNIDCSKTGSATAALAISQNLTIKLNGSSTISLNVEAGTQYDCIAVDGEYTLIIEDGKGDGSGALTLSEDLGGNQQCAIYLTNGANLVINSGVITATSGYRYPAIGAGTSGTCGDITINGGTVNATGSGLAAAIGSGNGGECGNITINGGTVIANGVQNGPGIGAGVSGVCGDIVLAGGSITASGVGNNNPAIGAGSNGTATSTCGDIYITQGITSLIVSTSGTPTYLIGPGTGCTCGTVYLGGSSASDKSTDDWVDTDEKINSNATIYGWTYSSGTWSYSGSN